ncbi:sensor histidine kinase [Paenibacillus humicola]|uniref:sensor histidine kinase n=1 Tax=Paenibacillus humicola TaxID=3110540 RepID=UPI00237BA28E|nr:ATP-binding protein [Paenibacillus humicola]
MTAELIAKLQILFVFSIPESALVLWFSCAWLGLKPDRFLPRLLVYAVLFSVYVDGMLFVLPNWLYFVNSIAGNFILIGIIFPMYKLKKSFLLLSLAYFVALTLESTVSLCALFFGGYDSMMAGSVWDKIAACWPPLALLALVTAYMQKSGKTPAKRAFDFLLHIRSRSYFALMMLFFIQFCLLAILFSYLFTQPENSSSYQIFIYLSIYFTIIIAIYVFYLIARTRKEAVQAAQETYIGDMLRMFASIRGQRHDFINHVQVMYSLLGLGKYDQLRSYMEQVVQEIKTVSESMDNMPSPALAALFQAKTAAAEQSGIRFQYEISDTAHTFGAVTDIDLVRMIGNLIDNAFDEVMTIADPAEREVTMELFTDHSLLHIVVANRGRTLTEDELENIWKPGYTTKSGEHSGLGLANIRERALHYGGTVSAESDPERGVVFTVKLPVRPEIHDKPA